LQQPQLLGASLACTLTGEVCWFQSMGVNASCVNCAWLLRLRAGRKVVLLCRVARAWVCGDSGRCVGCR
jgi:hypothetical protein